MKTAIRRAKLSWIACQLTVLVGVFALGWYSARQTEKSVGTSTDGHTVKIRPNAIEIPSPTRAIGLEEAKATIAQMLNAPAGKIDTMKIDDYLESLDAETIQALLNDPTAGPLLATNLYAVRLQLIHRWAELNSGAAFAWVLNHDFGDKGPAINGIFMWWSHSDPVAAVAAMAQLKGYLHMDALRELIHDVGEKDPAGAFALIRNLPLGQAYGMYPQVFQLWTKTDPAAASAAALSLPASRMRDNTLENVASGWAQSDPVAAMAWAKTLASGAGKDSVMAQVFIALSQEDPSATATALAQYKIPPGETRDSMLGAIAINLAGRNPTDALDWIDQNFTGKDFETATAAALQQIGEENPAAAAALLAKIPDPGVFNQAMPEILENWGRDDPSAALAWAQALPADNVSARNTAITNVLSSWILTDPAVAGNYVLQNFATD